MRSVVSAGDEAVRRLRQRPSTPEAPSAVQLPVVHRLAVRRVTEEEAEAVERSAQDELLPCRPGRQRPYPFGAGRGKQAVVVPTAARELDCLSTPGTSKALIEAQEGADARARSMQGVPGGGAACSRVEAASLPQL